MIQFIKNITAFVTGPFSLLGSILGTFWIYLKLTLKILACWSVVSLLLVGGFTSYAWVKTSWQGYDWAVSFLPKVK